MPKELIHTNRAPADSDDHTLPLAVHVGWDRVGYVQVATVNLQYERHTAEHGWFADLDRGQINYMIRLLRRARDQAFGRDE